MRFKVKFSLALFFVLLISISLVFSFNVRASSVTNWLIQDQPTLYGLDTITIVDVNPAETMCLINVNGETEWINKDESGTIEDHVIKVEDVDYSSRECEITSGRSQVAYLPAVTGYACSVDGKDIYVGATGAYTCKIYEDLTYEWIDAGTKEYIDDVEVYVSQESGPTSSYSSCGPSGSVYGYWCSLVIYPECSNDNWCCDEYEDYCGACYGSDCLESNEAPIDTPSCVSGEYEVDFKEYDCSSGKKCSYDIDTKYLGSCCSISSECDDSNECTIDTCSSNQCFNTNEADDTPCSQGICQKGECVSNLNITSIVALQVVPDVDLVLGKTGILRATIENNNNKSALVKVNVTFEGYLLYDYDNASNTYVIKNILVNSSDYFDFRFKPTLTGQQTFNVTAVEVEG